MATQNIITTEPTTTLILAPPTTTAASCQTNINSIGQNQVIPQCAIGGESNSSCGNVATARLLDLGKKLIEATRNGNVGQVQHLVEEAGAPFTSDWLGATALHVAAQNGFIDIAEILVRGGVNREARTKLERTALHVAAQSGCLEIVDLLLNHGSDVNVKDMLRMTPLHWAVERGHVLVAERLILAGADIESTNKFLLTPIDIARESGTYEMIELFKVGNWIDNHNHNHNMDNTMDSHNLDTFTKNPAQILAMANAGVGPDILDLDYHLAFVDSATDGRNNSLLDNDDRCLDLVGLDLFLANEGEDEPKVEHLMKVVEELQRENQQLRQKVEQFSSL